MLTPVIMMRLRLCSLLLLAGAALRAQQPAEPGGCTAFELADSAARSARRDSVPGAGTTVASARPSIVLLASASAREVRFAAQPSIKVRLCGGVFDSVRVVERRNLPRPVQPGVTYRDVYVAVEILGHLNARCLAATITGQRETNDPCASLSIGDSTAARRPPQ